MPFALNIWNTLRQLFAGGGGFPNIPVTTAGGTKLYAMISTGQIPSVNSAAMAVGLSRTLII